MSRPHYGVSGLATDANPIGVVPDGSLLEASECVVRRLGVASPRPGFKVGSSTSLSNISAIVPYDGSQLLVGSNKVTRWANDTQVKADYVPTDGNFKLDAGAAFLHGCEARGALYLNTTDCPRRLTSSSDTVAYGVGMRQPFLIYASDAAGTAVEIGYGVAYRAAIRRKTSAGLITLSEPSGRFVWRNASGTARDVSLSVFFERYTSPPLAGDEVLLYRTAAVTSSIEPSDEMRLVKAYVLTSSDITAGYCTLKDTTPDAKRYGETLYTSPSREGIQRANICPPAALDMALYKGSMFYGFLGPSASRIIRWTEAGDCTGKAEGIGYRGVSTWMTNNRDDATLASATGIQVGMLVNGSMGAANWGNPTTHVRVTSLVGTDVVFSHKWVGSTGSQTISYVDSIKISAADGSSSAYHPAWAALQMVVSLTGANTGWPDANVRASVLSDFGNYINSLQRFARRVVELQSHFSTGTFELSATHGDEYDAPLPLISSNAPEDATRDNLTNCVTWSKQDEPEHFMRGQVWYVGNAKSPVLRIFGTQDALWILKGQGDGIYRLSGLGELNGWRVEQFDSTTFLLDPRLACQLGSTVYAWTNQGLVSIDDRGVIPLSGPKIGNLTREIERIFTIDKLGQADCSCVANQKTGEVIFSMGRVYVYNTRTQAFTTWFDDQTAEFDRDDVVSMAYDTTTNKLLIGTDDDGALRVELAYLDDFALHADGGYAVTISSNSGGNVVLSGAHATWVPKVGDIIATSSALRSRITAVTDSTHFAIELPEGQATIGTGAARAYVPFEARLAWLAKSNEGPSQTSRFRELTVHFESLSGVGSWSLEMSKRRDFAESQTRTLEEEHYTFAAIDETDVTPDVPADRTVLVPMEIGYATRIYPRFICDNADARWAISGLTEIADSVSTRVSL